MGVVISQQSGQPNTQTGHLGRTLLHKRYMLMGTVGQGGMGAVYKARDLKRQTICAVKEMSLSMVPPDERQQAIQNFKDEAKMLWGLNHPNLPSFAGFFTEGQRYFMVMEYVDGSTLEDLLERNSSPFPERRVLGWARQLCDVLEYLHNQNPPIIFRDMKPGNIMLMRTGRIKLIDFGIARFFRPTSAQDTQLLGTPGFAPPEQYGKAQTDERADIYSLAMTIFQLLTNTLSETGFGLKDVRSINPRISPNVARALEKATALEPIERYQNVAAFRRALLGVGTFVFDNGDQATTPQELADLCARHPEEASDYLASGEIESWLRELGEESLARAARQIRTTIDDPQEAVEQFLRAVMGPNARIRPVTAPATNGSRSGTVGPSTSPSLPSVPGRGWFSRAPRSNVQVQPRTLDFGEVYPGVSAPLTFTITGHQGSYVRGVIRATEPWIVVDQTLFDGMSTRVNVRINSTQLHDSTHYTGTILVSPEDEEIDIVVSVEADILNLGAQGNWRRNGGKTIGADLNDEDEDEDALTMGPMSVLPITGKGPAIRPGQVQAIQVATPQKMVVQPTGLPQSATRRDAEYKLKYGAPTTQSGNSVTSQGWDPLHATTKQRTWMQYIFAFVAACMVASLCYTLLTPLVHSALPPSPWFILLLILLVPTATLGSLLAYWNRTWTIHDLINRGCTGMGSALALLALVEIIWQFGIHGAPPPLQFGIMLFITALGATLGTTPKLSDYILDGAGWAVSHQRKFVIGAAAGIGGVLGFFLTSGFALGCFTPFGVLLGIAVCVGLVLRVDQLLRHGQQKTP